MFATFEKVISSILVIWLVIASTCCSHPDAASKGQPKAEGKVAHKVMIVEVERVWSHFIMNGIVFRDQGLPPRPGQAKAEPAIHADPGSIVLFRTNRIVPGAEAKAGEAYQVNAQGKYEKIGEFDLQKSTNELFAEYRSW
ncbi:MAG: hypothetical protein JST84_11235 [Acidobacteria bacterium]|nr:hypothetical protein [Acidobacteriota bacterium]